MPSNAPRRIGLNLLYLRPGIVGGTETYARGLITGLAEVGSGHEFLVFVNRSGSGWPLPDGFTRVVCPVSPRQGIRYAYEQAIFPLHVRRHRLDLLHSLAYVAPLAAPCARVVTIHDLNYREPSHRMPVVRRLALTAFVSGAIRSSHAVIAVSRFTRDELGKYWPDELRKVRVVHEASTKTSEVLRDASGSVETEAPYFIAFSSASPNKNLERLLQAQRLAVARGLGHRLILVGHRPADVAITADGVTWTGYVPDSVLHGLVQGAEALLYPSLYEGFGLPLLEAMEAGVPVACSRFASLPEVAGEAALYFDAMDTASIAEAMLRLARDPKLRADLAARGRMRLAQFSWRRAAEETLEVYDDALRARRRGMVS